jgi:beta-glucosidase
MRDFITDGRLIPFLEEEKELLKGTVDFFGVNYYTASYTRYVGPQPWTDTRTAGSLTNATGHVIGPQADSSWLYVYPEGLSATLEWVNKRYSAFSPKLYIFENGVSVPGENNLPVSEAVHDEFRVNYIDLHLKEIEKTIKKGVNVKAYFAWFLMDNFEWADGYGVRFGMIYVDYNDNQKRYLKDSVHFYSDYIKKLQAPLF